MKIETLEKDKTDDFFIACSSFEERTQGGVNSLSENYRTKNSIIFVYDEFPAEPEENRHRLSVRENLKKKISGYSDNLPLIIFCNRENSLDGLQKFKKILSEKKIQLENARITLDITVFTKQYLLVLLRYLHDLEKCNLQLIYSEPEKYDDNKEGPLTSGIKGDNIVPSYEGAVAPTKNKLLILLLGYEGERAYYLYDKEMPNKTICLIGKPGFKPGWSEKSEKFNFKILNVANVEKRYISIDNIDAVFDGLEGLIQNYMENSNLVISPLGSKLQTVALYLLCRKYSQIRVIYALPKKYSSKDYSAGIGKVHLFRLPKY